MVVVRHGFLFPGRDSCLDMVDIDCDRYVNGQGTCALAGHVYELSYSVHQLGMKRIPDGDAGAVVAAAAASSQAVGTAGGMAGAGGVDLGFGISHRNVGANADGQVELHGDER